MSLFAKIAKPFYLRVYVIDQVEYGRSSSIGVLESYLMTYPEGVTVSDGARHLPFIGCVFHEGNI